MIRIYISSTYSDLKEFRERAYRILRQLGHDVIAMEDYIATDQRPLDKCLEDVRECDLYIGIFAWRYGYIPQVEENPERKSITELEFREAKKSDIECLTFLHDEDSGWPPNKMDTGENLERIRSLRNQLSQDALVSFFSDVENLAALISTAVSKWEKRRELKQQTTQSNNTHTQVGAISLNQNQVIQHHYAEYATIRFSITNLSSEIQKVPTLQLKVYERREISSVRLKKAGAMIQEFHLNLRFDKRKSYDLFAELDVQEIIEPGGSDAFNLKLVGDEGMLYLCKIEAIFEDLASGVQVKTISSPFQVEYPIQSVEKLRERKKLSDTA